MVLPKIEEETDDRIVLLVDSVKKDVWEALFGIAGFSFLFVIFPAVRYERFLRLLCILSVVILVLMKSYTAVVKRSVIIDRKPQSVIIKKDSPMKYLRYSKEIPFSHIKEIEILHWIERYSQWKIALITIGEKSVQIYEDDRSESEVEKIAEKICRITDANVTHRTHYAPPSYCDPELR
ncbi:MAG: hypothetical protein C5S48_02240 [Candidatus Methanogaster sp.]|nr:MAG: hypothetical protein C5S48_02240 [ANME-2 cluster archaeon]